VRILKLSAHTTATDGSQLCSPSGNTPSAGLTPGFQSLGSASGNADMMINYFGMSLNTAR